ncbi:MAG: hypothetical protein V4555_10210 [Acidobacteriota bacterium]
MDDLDAKPNPEEDMKHAHAMLARMSPEELLTATYALEDILDGAVYVTNLFGNEDDEIIDDDERRAAEQGRKDLSEGRTCSLEELLEVHGLAMSDLAPEAQPSRPATAPATEAARTAA